MIRVRVPVHQIDFVCRIIEGHEDLGLARTEDGTRDIVQLWIPRGMLEDAQSLVGTLEKEGLVQVLDGPTVMVPDGPAIW
jgi:hypothetical protein